MSKNNSHSFDSCKKVYLKKRINDAVEGFEKILNENDLDKSFLMLKNILW